MWPLGMVGWGGVGLGSLNDSVIQRYLHYNKKIYIYKKSWLPHLTVTFICREVAGKPYATQEQTGGGLNNAEPFATLHDHGLSKKPCSEGRGAATDELR